MRSNKFVGCVGWTLFLVSAPLVFLFCALVVFGIFKIATEEPKPTQKTTLASDGLEVTPKAENRARIDAVQIDRADRRTEIVSDDQDQQINEGLSYFLEVTHFDLDDIEITSENVNQIKAFHVLSGKMSDVCKKLISTSEDVEIAALSRTYRQLYRESQTLTDSLQLQTRVAMAHFLTCNNLEFDAARKRQMVDFQAIASRVATDRERLQSLLGR